MQNRLTRSESDKMAAGVCGGIAAYLNVDPILVRFAFFILIFASGIGFPLYLILMILMPAENKDQAGSHPPLTDLEKNINLLNDSSPPAENLQSLKTGRNPQGPIIFATLLILLGFYLLAQNVGFLGFLNLGWFGPLLIIGIGLFVIFRRR
jgi:phage shock protein PspC (stress-responsive transcriptional regulator)